MDEQRILDEIERRLTSTDPGLATRLAAFGAPRHPLAARMRRLRLLASFSTLLVVAVVSLVVYTVMPFRSGAERGGSGKPGASPPQPAVMLTPAHRTGAPPASAKAASAGPSAAASTTTVPGQGTAAPSRASAASSAQASQAVQPVRRATRPQ